MQSRIDRLHAPGLIDLHYDLGMDLYEKRREPGVLVRDYRDDMRAGGMGLVAACLLYTSDAADARSSVDLGGRGLIKKKKKKKSEYVSEK